jgi:type IV secretory pathway TrbL component
MIRLTLNALPHLPNTTEAGKAAAREAVVALLAHLGPRDPVEAMLATQLVLAHYHAVITFCRMALGDLPINLHHRYQSKAIALSRMCQTAIHDLQRRQGGAGQTVAARRASVPQAQPAAAADIMARLAAAMPKSDPGEPAPRPAGAAPVEGRHERRRREYFERRQAAAAARSPGLGADAIETAVMQLVAAEVAARAAAPVAVAA